MKQWIGELLIQMTDVDGTRRKRPNWHVVLVEESEVADEFGRFPSRSRMIDMDEAERLGLTLDSAISEALIAERAFSERAEQLARIAIEAAQAAQDDNARLTTENEQARTMHDDKANELERVSLMYDELSKATRDAQKPSLDEPVVEPESKSLLNKLTFGLLK